MDAKVYLTGAGPGDPALITLKAKNAIEKSDVILYDNLANNRFLDYAAAGAEKIYVGKKAADHRYTQTEIEELIIKKVKEGKNVCRLKGGDPFVYGRGGEEALILREKGIEFEIIPGVSSALAAPLYAGIPLTQRHIASSFAVITGHEAADKKESTIEIEKIATAVDTLVVLMGVGNLDQITERVLAAGRSPETPAALVRWGTRSKQETIKGTLANIATRVKEADFKPPAVIVIGEVVNLRKKLAWFEAKKLFGRNILVTRPPAQSASFVEMIEAEAGNAVLAPTIEIKAAAAQADLKRAVEKLNSYSHLIFTSVNGVKYFARALKEAGLDLRALAGIKIMTIGSKTAETLAEIGIIADYMPEDYSTTGMLSYLKELGNKGELNFKQASFLLPRSDIAPELLEEELLKTGAAVDNVNAYRTAEIELEPEILELLLREEISLLTFTSSSTVDNFIRGIKKLIKKKKVGAEYNSRAEFEKMVWQKIKQITAACIGPVTAARAENYDLNVEISAKEYTIEGLMEAILNYYHN